jgi:hypothetical protein
LKRLTWLLWLWLAAGFAVFLHGAITGGGLAGRWLYHDLVTSHEVSPDFVNEVLFVGLCVPPLAVLAWRGRRLSGPRIRGTPPVAAFRRMAKIFLAAGVAFGAIGGILWIVLDTGADTRPPGGSVSSKELGGPPRFLFNYDVVVYGKTHTYRHQHSLWAVSAGGRTAAIIDAREVDRFPGAVLRTGGLPAYVVWALRAGGLPVPDDVPVFVPIGKTNPVGVYLLVAGAVLTVLSLILSLVMALSARIARR